MPTLNDIPDAYILGLCAIFGLAAALLCVILGRGAWRWWRRRRWKPVTTPLHGDGFSYLHLSESAYMDADANFARALASIPPHGAVVLESTIKDAPVPYRPRGGPVPNAPVTRAEFEELKDDVANIAEDLDADFDDVFSRPVKLEEARRLNFFYHWQKNMGRPFRKRPGADPDSGIRVWEWNNGYTSPTNWLWDGKKMWHRDHVFPWGDAPASPSPARLLKTNAHLDVRELHGDEKAHVVADWRENKPK